MLQKYLTNFKTFFIVYRFPWASPWYYVCKHIFASQIDYHEQARDTM